MANSKTMQAIRIVAGTFLGIVAVCSYIGAAVILGFTFVGWWIPASIGFAVALFTGVVLSRMWRWLTCRDEFLPNFLCHVVFFTGFIMNLLLLVNYWVPSSAPTRHEKAVITKVYREKHYQSKRVGRRYYSRGAPYYVYKADLSLNNGNSSAISLSKKKYDRLHKGDSLGVVLAKGFFGWEELRMDSIQYPAEKKKRHIRPRYHRSL